MLFADWPFSHSNSYQPTNWKGATQHLNLERRSIINSTTPASIIYKFIRSIVLLIFIFHPNYPLQVSSKIPIRQWSSRVVTTKLGPVRGFIFKPSGYEGVEIFMGLPYASPPLGSLRFMPPVSGSPWTGIKMNSVEPQVCPQVFPLKLYNETDILKEMPKGRLQYLRRLEPMLRNQSEDCLYLNIFVPLTVANGKMDGIPLPVMVLIQGEDFGYGGGHPFDPSMLAMHGNVIVITLNFRLGMLGFLNANSDGYFKSPANFALLDQIAALHWVKENIRAFGGDNNNVTVMGHGKGAMYVNFLMISNAVPTTPSLLFHRVILMSGSALSPLKVSLTNGKELARKFASAVKCPVQPPSNMLECLRQIPLQYFLDSELWSYFGPSEDGVVVEAGIRENVLRDKLSLYPLLFGVTTAEMLPSVEDHIAVYGLEAEKRRELLKRFIDETYSTRRSEILAAAIHEYTDWERPVQHPISVRDETLDALGDAQIVAPLVKVGELHSQGSSRTYFYVFEYQSKLSDYTQRLGCIPGEELAYVLGVPLYHHSRDNESSVPTTSPIYTPEIGDSTAMDENHNDHRLGVFLSNFTRNEFYLSVTLVHLWANFITTGDPNSEGIRSSYAPAVPTTKSNEKFKVVEWPPYDTLFKKYLSIEGKLRVRNHYRAHKLSFWMHLVPTLMKSGYSSSPPNTLDDGNESVSMAVHPLSSAGKEGKENSFSQSPPSIQLLGSPYWDSASFFTSMNHSRSHQYDNSGFPIYSTALSVTIAVGCSLLILNILLFAAFYYYKDRRWSATHPPNRSPIVSPQRHQSQHSDPSPMKPLPSNGQVPNMPNICGDLPPTGPSPHPQMFDMSKPTNFHHPPTSSSTGSSCSTLPSNNRHHHRSNKSKSTLTTGGLDLSMPDAILAAALMLNYQNPNSESPLQDLLKSSKSPMGRKSGINMRDQLLLSNDQSSTTSSRPKVPKRHTPTVKFSPDTFAVDLVGCPPPPGDSGEDSSSNNLLCGPSSTTTGGTEQQLKPSLKKNSSYGAPSSGISEEMQV